MGKKKKIWNEREKKPERDDGLEERKNWERRKAGKGGRTSEGLVEQEGKRKRKKKLRSYGQERIKTRKGREEKEALRGRNQSKQGRRRRSERKIKKKEGKGRIWEAKERDEQRKKSGKFEPGLNI